MRPEIVDVISNPWVGGMMLGLRMPQELNSNRNGMQYFNIDMPKVKGESVNLEHLKIKKLFF